MDISVIIPTHNNESTIERAILSVLEQSFEGEYEVCLACDDCTDGTVDIVKRLQEAHSNIHYVEVSVKGDLRSRMAAMDLAKGDYFMFLDGDDYFHKDALKIAYGTMKEEDADIGNFSLFYVTKESTRASVLGKRAVYDRRAGFKAFFHDFTYRGFMATKIFKRKVVESIGFSYSGGMMIYMDALYNFLAIAHADKIVSIPEHLYYYNKANNDAQTAKGHQRVYDNLTVRAAMRRYIDTLQDPWLLKEFRKNKKRIRVLLMVDFTVSTFDDKKQKKEAKRISKREISLIYGKEKMPLEGYSYSKPIQEIGFEIGKK